MFTNLGYVTSSISSEAFSPGSVCSILPKRAVLHTCFCGSVAAPGMDDRNFKLTAISAVNAIVHFRHPEAPTGHSGDQKISELSHPLYKLPTKLCCVHRLQPVRNLQSL